MLQFRYSMVFLLHRKRQQITHGSRAPAVAQTIAAAEREEMKEVDWAVFFSIPGWHYSRSGGTQFGIWCRFGYSFLISLPAAGPRSRNERRVRLLTGLGHLLCQTIAGAEQEETRMINCNAFFSIPGAQLLTVWGEPTSITHGLGGG